MEILFMVFMVVVSIMALFAVMVVFRDVVSEVLEARRERERADRSIIQHAERIIAEAEAKAASEAVKEVPVVVAPAKIEEPVAPVIEVVDEAPVIEEEPAKEEEPAVEEEAPEAEENADGTISFSLGQQQTLDEKYLALPQEQRGWYDEIIKYASAVEGSKRVKNARYEEYKVGKNRLVRLVIKRGVINCEYILHNSDFKNYVNENKISVKQSATTMLIETAASVDVVKNTIDIVVAQIAEEKEYKKRLAREKRRAARAAQASEK